MRKIITLHVESRSREGEGLVLSSPYPALFYFIYFFIFLFSACNPSPRDDTIPIPDGSPLPI